MASKVLYQIVKSLKWCCPYEYLTATLDIKTELLAAELGVSKRTIRNWRAKLRNGDITCDYDFSTKQFSIKKITDPRSPPHSPPWQCPYIR